MNEWQLLLLMIALIGAASVTAGSINGSRRMQAMIENENRRRMIVVRRYFDDGEPVRIFRDEDGTITSVHRQRDGEAVIFAGPESYSGHTFTGSGHAAH